MTRTGNSLHTIKGRAVASFFNRMSINVYKNPACQILGAFILLILTTQLARATGTDLLASQQTTVSSTFGAGSSIVKWFYIAEIIIALFTYIKVRSPLVFLGLVICIIFTRIAFAIAA